MTDRTIAIARIIVAAIIEIAGIIGFSLPIGEESLYCIVASIVMCATFCYTAWKNHNFTHAASQVQILLDSYKSGDIETIEGVQSLVEHIHEKSGIEDADE